jgi:glyceraldehyde 3-phosphate dehydrogenase
MAIRIAINGFGRIGRMVLRAGWGRSDIEFVHINDLTADDMLAYLLRRDSVHGSWGTEIKAVEGGISIDGKVVKTSAEKDPSKLPWKASAVDIVFECTGRFTDTAKAKVHLDAGAKRVIISAPAEGQIDATFVVGINDHTYDPAKHFVVSNASCTTNCLAPMAKVMNDLVGIERGVMTTIHSYTMDQNLLDSPHKKFRRARAAGLNMVPTSTGAAKAIGLVIPELKGKLDGYAIRVPTPNVSLTDLTFVARRATTKDEINAAFRKAAQEGPLKGILFACDEEIVSSDVNGDPHSSVVDLDLTTVVEGTLVKVYSWYDNEWGFSNRMLDLAKRMAG